MPYLADNSYLAIKAETTAGVAVVPDIFVPLVSESIKTVVNQSVDQRIKGINWKGNDIVRGFRSHEGDIEVLGDADTLGHFLNMVFSKSSTTGNSTDGYTHTFVVGTPKTYTVEIKKGNYSVRYFGVRIDELKLEFEDGQLKLTASVKAMGCFQSANLGVTTSGAVTSVTLDDEYDINPTRGLVVGDKLDIDGVEVTLSSINSNGVSVGFTSTTVGKTAGARVMLKPLSATVPTVQEPLFLGNLLAGFGADESSATTNATQALSTPLYDLSVTLKNNLFSQNGSNRLDPVSISPTIGEAQIECKQLLESADQLNKWLMRTKQAITFLFNGKFIKNDFTTKELLTLKFHNVKSIEDNQPLNVGEFIMDELSYEALYDNVDGKAITCTLVNRTAGSSY